MSSALSARPHAPPPLPRTSPCPGGLLARSLQPACRTHLRVNGRGLRSHGPSVRFCRTLMTWKPHGEIIQRSTRSPPSRSSAPSPLGRSVWWPCSPPPPPTGFRRQLHPLPLHWLEPLAQRPGVSHLARGWPGGAASLALLPPTFPRHLPNMAGDVLPLQSHAAGEEARRRSPSSLLPPLVTFLI